MDASTIWNLVDSGGALGALVVFAAYLIVQNRALSKRNDELADRNHEQHIATTEILSGVRHAIERLGDKLGV